MKTFSVGISASSKRAAFLAGAALLCLQVPGVAYAQESEEAQPAANAPPADEGYGNEIVVTATKREQTLQDVPVAVTVTTAQTIERAFVRDIKDLATLVPSLRVGDRQNSTNVNFLIRGFGNGANNAGIEPSVGVFVDGVYRSRSASQIGDLPDVQRVEVLRGPQSTLFGKNASAGVVSIITQKPQFKFGGNLEASYGNYDAVVLKGVVTGPLTETIAVSLAAGYNKRDGYIPNLGTGNATNERHRWFVRGQALFQPIDALSVRIIGDYGKIDELCCGVANVRASGATAVINLLGGRVNPASDPFSGVYTNFDSTNKVENYGISGQIDYETGPLTLTSITAYRRTKSEAFFDSDFSSADLLRGANIGRTSFKTFTQELRVQANIVDRVNVLLGAFYFHEDVEQATDLRWGAAARPYFNVLVQGASRGALSLFGAGPVPVPLEATLGALEGNPARYIGQFFAAGQGMAELDTLKNKNFSLFSQVDFKVTDRLTLTGGIAYTNDKKRFSITNTSNDVFAAVNLYAPAYAPLRNQLLVAFGLQSAGVDPTNAAAVQAFATNPLTAPTFAQIVAFAAANQNSQTINPLTALRELQIFAPFLNIPNVVEPGRTSDDKFTYTARLAYDVSDNINAYVSYATGYKASSINLSRDSRPSPADRTAIEAAGIGVVNQTYTSRFAGPENSEVFEAGLKASWPNLSVNAAVFKQSIKGFQSNIFTGLAFVLSNAGKQSVRGFEVEGNYRPLPGLSLSGAVTYLDPKYDDFRQSPFGDATGIRPSDIPAWSFTVGAEYDHELANSNHLIGRVSFHHESEVQVVEGLPGFIQTDPLTGQVVPGGFQPGLDAAKPFTREVNQLDASLTYVMGNGIELSAWGRNLTDNRNISTIFDSPAQPDSVSAYPNQPRTYGAAIRFRW